MTQSLDQELDLLRQLLKKWTLEKYLQTRPPSTVITVTDSMTVGKILQLLANCNILSAPVFRDDSSTCVGFIDLNDVLQALLKWFRLHDSNGNRLAHLEKAGKEIASARASSIALGQSGRIMSRAEGCYKSLLEVVNDKFLGGLEEGRCHRLALYRPLNPDLEPAQSDGMGPMSEGACPPSALEATSELAEAACCPVRNVQFTHIISQSDIIRFLYRHVEELGQLAQRPVRDLFLEGAERLVLVPDSMSTIDAFVTMLDNDVSGIGITTVNGGRLVASLSASDLRGLLPGLFPALALPVRQYAGMDRVPPERAWINQAGAAQQVYGVKGADANGRPLKVATCQPQSPLLLVLQILAEERHHRVFVVDDQQRAVGIISLTDILMLASDAYRAGMAAGLAE